jgi:2-polyprenyl-3-methyl-5-hydroxy-6-metoxy-1,4-benzoquinol methylase
MDNPIVTSTNWVFAPIRADVDVRGSLLGRSVHGGGARFGPDDPEADPRVPETYGAENPWGIDDDFVMELASQAPRPRIVDLGCGTGRLAIALAATGAVVTAVDPNPAMLRQARSSGG